MLRSRCLLPLLTAAVLTFGASAGSGVPVTHDITFNPIIGVAPTGTFVVDDAFLTPNNQISCTFLCDFISFQVTFQLNLNTTAVFDLSDGREGIFANTDGNGDIVSLRVLMFDSNLPGASNLSLNMLDTPLNALAYQIVQNPTVGSGTYTISVVPEPGTALMVGGGLLGLIGAARRARR